MPARVPVSRRRVRPPPWCAPRSSMPVEPAQQLGHADAKEVATRVVSLEEHARLLAHAPPVTMLRAVRAPRSSVRCCRRQDRLRPGRLGERAGHEGRRGPRAADACGVEHPVSRVEARLRDRTFDRERDRGSPALEVAQGGPGRAPLRAPARGGRPGGGAAEDADRPGRVAGPTRCAPSSSRPGRSRGRSGRGSGSRRVRPSRRRRPSGPRRRVPGT